MSSAVAVSGDRFRNTANRLQVRIWLFCVGGLSWRAHVLDHALAQRADGIGTHRQLLSEVDCTSILRAHRPITTFSPSLAALADQSPRSGYRGSDLVQWHLCPVLSSSRARQRTVLHSPH
jgi:hypothetical protein